MGFVENEICFTEFVSKKRDVVKKFFEGSMGWSFAEHKEGYDMITTKNKPMCGSGLREGVEQENCDLVIYVKVKSIAESLKRIKDNPSEKIVTLADGKAEPMGLWAIVLLPGSVSIGLWEDLAATHPEDKRPSVVNGSVGFLEFCSSDLPATLKAVTFLFGWTPKKMPGKSDADYYMHMGPGKEKLNLGFRALNDSLPAPSDVPCALAYLNVPAITKATEEGEALGAKVVTSRVAMYEMGWFVKMQIADLTFAFWQYADKEAPLNYFSYVEFATKDREMFKKYLTACYGWTTNAVNAGFDGLRSPNKQKVGSGIRDFSAEKDVTHCIPHVRVLSLPETLKKLKELSKETKILREEAFEPFGRMAVTQLSTGDVISFFEPYNPEMPKDERPEGHQNIIGYSEILTGDLEGVKKLLTDLLGWEWDVVSEGYFSLKLDDKVKDYVLDTGLRATLPNEKATFVPYFTVDDYDSGLSKAKENGSKPVGDKTEIAGYGAFTYVTTGDIHNSVWTYSEDGLKWLESEKKKRKSGEKGADEKPEDSQQTAKKQKVSA